MVHSVQYSRLLHGPLCTILSIAKWFSVPSGHLHGPLCTMLGMAKWSTLYNARYGQMAHSVQCSVWPNGPLCTMLGMAKWSTSYNVRYGQMVHSVQCSVRPNGPPCTMLGTAKWSTLYKLFCRIYTIRILRITLSTCLFLCVLGSFFFFFFFFFFSLSLSLSLLSSLLPPQSTPPPFLIE